MDPAAMRSRVAAARVGRLGTLDPDGRVHLVPVCFALEDDTVVSAVDAKPKSTTRLQRLRNVTAHPHATLLVDRYDEDWSSLWWVRVRGEATIISGGPRWQSAVDLLRDKYSQYRAQPPEGPVIALSGDDWSGWAASPS